MRTFPRRSIAPALLAALAAAACQRDQQADDDLILGDYAEESTRPEEFAAPEAAESGTLNQVTAVFDGRTLELTQDTVPAGPVSIVLMNTSKVDVGCRMRGAGREWRTDVLLPNGAVTWNERLGPGVYRLDCPQRTGELAEGADRSGAATLTVR